MYAYTTTMFTRTGGELRNGRSQENSKDCVVEQ